MMLEFPTGLLGLLLVSLAACLPLRARLHWLALLGLAFNILLNPMVAGILLCSFLWAVLRLRRTSHKAQASLLLLLAVVMCLPAQSLTQWIPLHPYVLLPWNLQRIFHLIFEHSRGKMKTATTEGFWWYAFGLPFVLGSIEWFHDFWSAYRKKQIKPDWKLALHYGLKAFWQSWLALSLYQLLPWQELRGFDPNHHHPFYGVVVMSSVGASFILGVASMFSYARTLAAISGIRLKRPLFGKLWKSRSVVEFWSQWNIPNIVFVREYFFLPLIRHSRKRSLQFIFLALCLLWLQQAWWHGSPQWALLNLGAILLQVRYTTLKAQYPGLRDWARRWFPDLAKTIITLLFIGLTGLLWPLGSPDAFLKTVFWLFNLKSGFLPSAGLFMLNGTMELAETLLGFLLNFG